MAAGELVLPMKQVDAGIESVARLEEISELLTDTQKYDMKKDKEQLELEKKQLEQDVKLTKMFALGELGPKQYKYLKMKNQQLVEEHKWTVKKKLFKTMAKGFANMGQQTEGWLKKLLVWLMVFAIFDPKGKFLTSILRFIVSMAIMLIKVIIKWVPMIIKTMADLFWNVLLPELGRAGKEIAAAFGFAKDGPIAWIFGKLLQALPIFILFFGLAFKLQKIYMKMKPVIDAIKKFNAWRKAETTREWVLEKKRAILRKIRKAKEWAIEKANAAKSWAVKKAQAAWKLANDAKEWAAAQVLAFRKWAWDKKIRAQQWMWEKKKWAKEKAQQAWKAAMAAKDWILEKARNAWTIATKTAMFLWEKASILANFALRMMLDPIFWIIAALVGAIALVIIFKDEIWGAIKWVGKKLGKFFSWLWDKIKGPFVWLSEKLAKIFAPMVPIFSKIGAIFGKIGGAIKTVFGGIKKFIGSIMNWISTIGRVGAFDYATASDKKQEQWKKTSRLANLAKEAKEMGIKGVGAEGIIKSTAKEDDFKKYAKDQKAVAAQTAKLEAAIARKEAQDDKRLGESKKNTKAIKDNAEETKKNTEEIMKKKEIAEITEQFQSSYLGGQDMGSAMGGMTNFAKAPI